MVKVDHGVDSLILHWIVVSEHDLEIDTLDELSGGLVGKNFVDVGLELILVELSTSELAWKYDAGTYDIFRLSFINFLPLDTKAFSD